MLEQPSIERAGRNGEVARRGIMLVLSSPSGAGKTTLSRLLLERYATIELSVSVTTRKPRPGEIDGKDYHFIDRARFDAMVASGELLEWAEVFGNRYGTPRAPVERVLAAGRDVLFDIDWQGTQQLREKGRDDLVSVFVLPPSIPDLEARLRTRAQDADDVIHARMSKAVRRDEPLGGIRLRRHQSRRAARLRGRVRHPRRRAPQARTPDRAVGLRALAAGGAVGAGGGGSSAAPTPGISRSLVRAASMVRE